MRSVEIFKGKEIDDKKITRLREIAEGRYDRALYDCSYCGIETVQGLACIHGVKVDDEVLILGQDWFLCYKVLDGAVIFLEWVALDNKDYKFTQTVEMINALQNIFLQHKDKHFIASMRHDTSYQFYLQTLQRGYFTELAHSVDIDFCNGFAPERLKYLEDDYQMLENFLNSKEADEHSEYLKYVLHDLKFSVTDKLVDKAVRLEKKL